MHTFCIESYQLTNTIETSNSNSTSKNQISKTLKVIDKANGIQFKNAKNTTTTSI